MSFVARLLDLRAIIIIKKSVHCSSKSPLAVLDLHTAQHPGHSTFIKSHVYSCAFAGRRANASCEYSVCSRVSIVSAVE